MPTTTMQYRLLLLLTVWLLGHHGILTSGCFEIEREALLTFRAGIIDTGNRLSSWAGRDCCIWRGVVCDNNTGHVLKLNLRHKYYTYANWSDYSLRGEINPSLLVLSHLSRLDLSWNDFGGISIPKFIGLLKSLMHLDLSRSNFSGEIPTQLGNLSNLRYLDLSDSSFTCKIPLQLSNLSRLHTLRLFDAFAFNGPRVDNLSWLSQLSSIRVLDLSQVNLSNATDWLEVVNTFHFLTNLSLWDCRLTTIRPSLSYLNFTSLKSLDISFNGPFNTTLPTWLWNLTRLSYLDLEYSGFHGKIPDSLGNLTSLESLYLGYNDFEGSIPRSIQNLCNLVSIGLNGLGIDGDIAEFVRKLCSWKNMEGLMLESNKLHGNLSSWLEEMKNLSFLDLSNNSLAGPIPPGIGRLSNLQLLDLSYNSLRGTTSEAHFANLSKLEGLILSSNSLIIDTDQNWIPPFQLWYLNLDSCQFLHHQFPTWLQSQMLLDDLSLANTSIADTIPQWFWNLSSLFNVDLSHNQIRGKLPIPLQFTNLDYLILRSNRLEGPIPSLPNTLGTLDLSENSISGPLPLISNMPRLYYLSLSSNRINSSIPSYICKLKQLEVLDLSNNSLSGELPQCWKNSSLLALDLSNNNITGKIPSSIGSLSSLKILHLNNNNFYGELPSELQHCTNLLFLDLSNNELTGEIPKWIGENMQDLVILQLRSNMLVGEIPSELAQLTYLQFLDLAHNNLTGSIPRSFGNFSAMIYGAIHNYDGKGFTVDKSNSTYSNYLLVVIQGEEYQYSNTIYLLKILDLSENSLSGQIPQEIVALASLRSLNLSGNHLIGTIPQRFGDMRSLESLDLSLNELQGAIPQSLSALTFLSYLNLSYNNLSGRIPTGNQLSTLDDPSIYIGNIYLCGPPTRKNCTENETMPNVVGDDYDGSESTWIYLSMILGFAAGFWSVCGILIFNKSWSSTYFQMIDRLLDKIYMIIAISTRRLHTNVQG